MTLSSTEHPTAKLRRLAAGEPLEPEISRHVASGCVPCATELRALLGHQQPGLRALLRRLFFGDEEPTEEQLEALRARSGAWAALGRAETEAAPDLLATLLALPAGKRREAVRTSPRYSSHGLALHLVEAARREGFRDPRQALELALLSVEVAETLESVGFPRRLALDAQALAWAMVANAHRIQAELIDAERAMAYARRMLAHGTGHPDVRAEVLSLEGSLRTDEGRFADAVEVLEEAAGIYRAFGEPKLEGKVLMKLGNAAGEMGDTERAVEQLERARVLIGAGGTGELPLLAGQALVGWLREAGRAADARRVLGQLQAEASERELSFYLRQRVAWAEARVLWSEGDLKETERALFAIRKAYGEHDQAYNYCLISLDLAVLYLEQGRTSEVRVLAEEMIPLFASRRIHHQALQALALFQGAAEAETATAAMVRDLARYLRHAVNNPYLPFRHST